MKIAHTSVFVMEAVGDAAAAQQQSFQFDQRQDSRRLMPAIASIR